MLLSQALVCLVPIGCLLCAADQAVEVRESTQTRHWVKIAHASAAEPKDVDDEIQREEYWRKTFYDGCQPEFWRMLQESDVDAQLEFFVDQFGEHGAQADIRWVSASQINTLCDVAPFPANARPLTPIDGKPVDLRQVQMKVSKHLVKRLLEDQKALERYWAFHLWYGFE